MKRKCNLLISSKNRKRAIFLDEENGKEILNYINRDDRHKKKFRFIAEIILEGYKNTEVYDKEEINNKCKGVTAMKFFKAQENDRIYCKEVHTPDGTFVVVAAILYQKKKTQQLNKKQIHIIEKVGSYQYEI